MPLLAASGIRRRLPAPAVSGARNSGGIPFLPAPAARGWKRMTRLSAYPQIWL
jgi:hypothetical protein